MYFNTLLPAQQNLIIINILGFQTSIGTIVCEFYQFMKGSYIYSSLIFDSSLEPGLHAWLTC